MGLRLVTLLLSATLLYGGCSKPAHETINSCGYTEVQFKAAEPQSEASFLESLPKLSGGLLIYAAGADHTETLYLNDESATGTITLPNGAYKFYAIGFANALTSSTIVGSLTSAIRCALVNSGQTLMLGGGSRTINIHLTEANCTSSSVFFPMPFDLRSCSPSYTFSGCPADICANCSPPGDAKTYRVKLLNYKKVSGSLTVKSAGIQSCIQAPVNAGTVASSSGVLLAFGQGADSPFAVEIATFDTVSTDCLGVPTRSFIFENGIYEALNIRKTLISGNLASFARDISTNPAHGQIYLVGGLGVTAPVANNSVFTTAENNNLNTTMSATDPQALALTYSIVSNGTLGTATITNAATGAFQYVPNLNAHGLDTVTFKVNNGIFDSNTATMSIRVMNAFTWTGAGANANWNTALNWYGTVAPNATQVAIFDGTCPVDTTCNANPSPTINVDPNVQGVEMNTGYTGTLTQAAGVAITIGSSGWIQAAGTFLGSASNITVNVGSFTLSGGTFTSTSGTFLFNPTAVSQTFFTYSGGTFTHNNGILSLSVSTNNCGATQFLYTMNVSSLIALNSIVWNGTDACSSVHHLNTTGAGSVEVQGTYTITNGGLAGTVNLTGNLAIGTGTRVPVGNTGVIVFSGTGAQTYSYSSGVGSPAININKSAGSVTPQGGTTTLVAARLLLTQGSFDAPVAGTLTLGRAIHANETILSVPTTTTFNLNNATLQFVPSDANGCTGDRFTVDLPNNFVLKDVQFTINGSCSTGLITGIGKNIIISGNLNVTVNGGSIGFMEGSWEVQGNYTASITGIYGGSAALTFSGGGAQTVTNNTAQNLTGLVTINKTAGTVTLASALSLNSAGQGLTITQGTLDLAGFNLTVNGAETIAIAGATLIKNGGTNTFGSCPNVNCP